MRGFPPELLYLLIFIGVVLFQFLMKRRTSQGPQEPPQDDDDVVQVPDEIPDELARLERATRMVWSPPHAPAEPPARREIPAAPRARAPRRFSRQALMGTQRDVQNAVVIAAILGPCRALEPASDPVAAAPPRRSAG